MLAAFFCMAKTRAQKSGELEQLTRAFKAAKSIVFVDYKGVTVKDVGKLRRGAEKVGVEYIVGKKTLIALAARAAGYDVNVKEMKGNVAVAFSMNDEIGAPQLVASFDKDMEAIKILGGMLEGKMIDTAQVKMLASLPTRQQLLGQLAGVLNAPIVGMASALAGITRGFVTALHGIEEQKSKV